MNSQIDIFVYLTLTRGSTIQTEDTVAFSSAAVLRRKLHNIIHTYICWLASSLWLHGRSSQ